MATIVGTGPFMTIPLIVSAAGGPQAMPGWVVGVCLFVVWAQRRRVWPFHTLPASAAGS